MSRRSWLSFLGLVLVAVVAAAVVLYLASDAAEEANVRETTTSTAGTATAGKDGVVAAIDSQGRLVVLDAGSGDLLRVALEGIDVGRPELVDLAVTPERDVAFVGGPRERILRVTLEGGSATVVAHGMHPAVSPDGSTLAYVSGNFVVLRDLERGTERRLGRRESISDIGWAGDRGTLLIVSDDRVSLLGTATATTLDTARQLQAGDRVPVEVAGGAPLLADTDRDGRHIYVARGVLWRRDGSSAPRRLADGIVAAAW